MFPNTLRRAIAIALALVAILSLSANSLNAQENDSNLLYVYDARALRNVDRAKIDDVRSVWDQSLLISALQGLVNRDAPRLYLLFVQAFGIETDEFLPTARGVASPTSTSY